MIDVLILNYNDAETTLSYIDHIVDYKVIHKIVVVDNCSTDDSVVLFQKHHFDKVEVIATKENGGYGSGNNYGIKYLVENYNSDYILISNPDVIVEENTIIQLELFLTKHEDYAIAAPFMLDKDYKKQINTAFRIPNLWDYILSFDMFWMKYKSKTFYKNILQEKVSCKTVDGVSGSMLMINAKHMIDYGMYDENIFLYCEEISLAIKLKKAGLKTALLPNYNFVHNHSVSISKTYSSELKKHKLLVKSKLYVIRHYYDANRVSYIFAWLMSRISIIETLIWAKVNKLKA